jgi:four helix bundle protein
MTPDELRDRTRKFANDVIHLTLRLPDGDLSRLVKPQLLRAATGTAANYRAACRSRSRREFISRLATVVEEADETALWLELLSDHRLGAADVVARLLEEAEALRRIFSRSRATAVANLKAATSARRTRRAEP